MLDRRVIRDLEGQVSPSHVYTRPADLAAYAYDAWGASGERHLPDAVVFPGSTEEVQSPREQPRPSPQRINPKQTMFSACSPPRKLTSADSFCGL